MIIARRAGQAVKGFLVHLSSFVLILFFSAVIVAGLFYGMIGETNFREIRATEGHRRWLHDRAIAWFRAVKDLHPANYVVRVK